jgi:hypothetical protein
MNQFGRPQQYIAMAGIGEDGTTTVQKLEGFQIDPYSRRSHFTVSEQPYWDVLEIPAAAYSINTAHRLQRHEAEGYRTLIMSEICWGGGHILENREGVAT